MMKTEWRQTKVAVLFAALALAGCDTEPYTIEVNQTLRNKLFMACLDALPDGPRETTYNDWDEVVAECGRQARDMSQRCVSGCRITYHVFPRDEGEN